MYTGSGDARLGPPDSGLGGAVIKLHCYCKALHCTCSWEEGEEANELQLVTSLEALLVQK